jgi:hypothetical protein
MICNFSMESARKVMENNQMQDSGEKCVLIDAYVDIARVYITRAARRGWRQTSIWLPNEIAAEVVRTAKMLGFRVEKHPNFPCRWIFKWDWDD